ncbi:Hormone-sensitive lipase [Fasciola gigantica]|uniref:Hormone-sensitive lipase n=1 Tax=Fasciola gigantica TaxID=46835 RepID=A0A504YHX8_FASGI|nr:Hormone-sensitive lipase [Fasciola gigantica]
MVDKKAIDEGECMQLMRLCAEVRLQCRTCTAILQASPPSTFMPWTSGTHMTLNSLQKLHLLLNSEFTNTLKFLYEIAGNYDFQEIRANGLRSFLIITTRCLASILTFLRGMTAASSWSRSNGNILIAYINCFGELHTCLNLLKLMPRFCAPGSSFPRSELVGLPEVGSASGCTPVDSAPGQVDTDHTESDDFMSEELVEFRNLQTRSDHIKQEYFYGHCVAFYFCPTAQRILLVLTSLMAGYGNSFLSSKQGLSNLVNTVFRSVTSYLSPEDRGAMVARVSRDLNVGFCKNFWSFAENRLIAEGPNVILPSMAIAHVFELAPRPLRLPVGTDLSASGSEPTGDVSQTGNAATVIVPYPVAHLGPTPLGVRLLSYRVRPGMEWAQPNLLSSIFQSARKPSSANDTNFSPDESGISSQKSSDSAFELGWKLSSPGLMSYSSSSAAPSSTAPQTVRESSLNDQSPYLLFHIHGGGFVALNSQAQDIFLRTWAEFLDCPIFSVNYSLAPQAPYPRALEECFFAYCWVTQNREKLGCKPDARIVLCGDSAGGNLVLGLCMRIIHSQILPRPSGALVAYAPIVISFCPTPARMLSLADPLLPVGILSKCILGKYKKLFLFVFLVPHHFLDLVLQFNVEIRSITLGCDPYSSWDSVLDIVATV